MMNMSYWRMCIASSWTKVRSIYLYASLLHSMKLFQVEDPHHYLLYRYSMSISLCGSVNNFREKYSSNILPIGNRTWPVSRQCSLCLLTANVLLFKPSRLHPSAFSCQKALANNSNVSLKKRALHCL